MSLHLCNPFTEDAREAAGGTSAVWHDGECTVAHGLDDVHGGSSHNNNTNNNDGRSDKQVTSVLLLQQQQVQLQQQQHLAVNDAEGDSTPRYLSCAARYGLAARAICLDLADENDAASAAPPPRSLTLPAEVLAAVTPDTVDAVAAQYHITASALRQCCARGTRDVAFPLHIRTLLTREEALGDVATLRALAQQRGVPWKSARSLRERYRIKAMHLSSRTPTQRTQHAAAAAVGVDSAHKRCDNNNNNSKKKRRERQCAAKCSSSGSGDVSCHVAAVETSGSGSSSNDDDDDDVVDSEAAAAGCSGRSGTTRQACQRQQRAECTCSHRHDDDNNNNNSSRATTATAEAAVASFVSVMGSAATTPIMSAERGWALAYVCDMTPSPPQTRTRCAALRLLVGAQRERNEDIDNSNNNGYDDDAAAVTAMAPRLHIAWMRRLQPLPLDVLQRCAHKVRAARALWQQHVVQPLSTRVTATHATVAQQQRNALCYHVCLWQRRHPLRLVCDVLELYRTRQLTSCDCVATASTADGYAHDDDDEHGNDSAALPHTVWLDELLEQLTSLLYPALSRVPWLVRCDVLMTYPHMRIDEQLQLMRDTTHSSGLLSHDNVNNDNDDDNSVCSDDSHSRQPLTPRRLLRGYVADDVDVPSRFVRTLDDDVYAVLRRGFELHKVDGVRRLCGGAYNTSPSSS